MMNDDKLKPSAGDVILNFHLQKIKVGIVVASSKKKELDKTISVVECETVWAYYFSDNCFLWTSPQSCDFVEKRGEVGIWNLR